jgi:hypothetical protein
MTKQRMYDKKHIDRIEGKLKALYALINKVAIAGLVLMFSGGFVSITWLSHPLANLLEGAFCDCSTVACVATPVAITISTLGLGVVWLGMIVLYCTWCGDNLDYDKANDYGEGVKWE